METADARNGMTDEPIDVNDVVWPSDLTVADVRARAGGLRLTIDDYSPDGEEFGVARHDQLFCLPFRLHFTNGRTARVPDSEMHRLIDLHGPPETWRGHVARVVVTDGDRFSGRRRELPNRRTFSHHGRAAGGRARSSWLGHLTRGSPDAKKGTSITQYVGDAKTGRPASQRGRCGIYARPWSATGSGALQSGRLDWTA